MTALRDRPIAVDELPGDVVVVAAAPEHAPPVRLYVVPRRGTRYGPAWVVSRSADGIGVITGHAQQHSAVRSAMHRARRYVAAYSVPRTLTGATR